MAKVMLGIGLGIARRSSSQQLLRQIGALAQCDHLDNGLSLCQSTALRIATGDALGFTQQTYENGVK